MVIGGDGLAWIALGSLAGAICSLAMSGCERPDNPPDRPASARLGGAAAALAPSTNIACVIVRLRGASDRPPPVLVFAAGGSDAAHAAAAVNASEPMGATPSAVGDAAYACLVGAIPSGASGAAIEVEHCGASPRRVLLDKVEGERWLAAASACVGAPSEAGRLLESMRTLLRAMP